MSKFIPLGRGLLIATGTIWLLSSLFDSLLLLTSIHNKSSFSASFLVISFIVMFACIIVSSICLIVDFHGIIKVFKVEFTNLKVEHTYTTEDIKVAYLAGQDSIVPHIVQVDFEKHVLELDNRINKTVNEYLKEIAC